MKKRVFYMILALCPVFVFGQKMAYLHTDSILLSIPQYASKMAKLDSVRQGYSKEVETGVAGVQSQYEKLITPYAPKNNETVQALKSRMSVSDTLQLSLLQKEAAQWQEKRQTYDKMLQNQYNLDVQPLLNKVNAAVADYAKANGLSAVYSFEQLRGALIYIDTKLNITGVIIRKLKQK